MADGGGEDGDDPTDSWPEVGQPSGSSEGRRREYRLTDRERSYIRTGETGTDRPSRLEENIRSKRDRLPERLRELFLDVEDLKHGDYFEPREWEDEWMRLMEVSSSENADREFSRFGRKLGKMTRQTALYPEAASETDVWADLIFGFIDGLCFHNWDQHPRQRDEFLQTILSRVEDRSAAAFDGRASQEEAWFDQWSNRQRAAVEGEQKIVETLESEGIEEPRRIALKVARILGDGRGVQGPGEVTSEAVLEIVDAHELLLRRELRDGIDRDIEKLRSREWGGLTPLDSLEHFSDTIRPTTSREIADEIGSPQKYLSTVVKLNLFLVGEEEIDGGVWEGLPAIELVGDIDTYGQRKWQLTDYGRALRAIYLDKSHSFRSLKGKEFTQEHFEIALSDPDVREHHQD